MDRLLAVNGGMAVYHHDESAPAKRVDPFKYLNELLSIRSAKGLVSFLQQYPDELVVMHEATAFKSKEDGGYVVGNYAVRQLKTARSKRGLLYGNGEQWKPLPKKELEQAEEDDNVPADPENDSDNSRRTPMFSFGETALMNAASEYNVDYFDALTDLEKYTHYGEALEAWSKSIPTPQETWTAEETRRFYEAEYSKPKPELRIVFFEELELLVLRLGALLEMAAVSHGIKDRVADDEVMFEFEHVNGPMGLCRTVFPERYIADLLPIPQALYALDNLHTDFYSHATTRLHLEDDGGVSFLAHTNDERLATQDAAGCIVSFVLAEWSHYYNKTDTMSFDVNFGYQLYEQNNNPVVTELCRIIAEGRFGICPVCDRPFVVKRRPINGVINKRFCTNSCKVKGFVGRRADEQQS